MMKSLSHGRITSRFVIVLFSFSFVFLFFFFFFCLFAFSRAAPEAYGGSQAKGLIGAVATGLLRAEPQQLGI